MTSRRPAKTIRKLLTEAELEIMSILWRLGEGSVAHVIQGLPAHRRLAYTSVSTILRILEQKGIVGSRQEGRGHVYAPLVPKETYEAVSLRHLIGRVFDGAPVSLVRRLIEEEDLTPSEIGDLQRLLDLKARS